MNIKSIIIVLLVNLCFLSSGEAQSQQPNKIQINSASQWQTWKYPKDCLQIGDNGISPKGFRKNINAVLDAKGFSHKVGDPISSKKYTSGGVKDAGSNLRDAANVMDGDMNTYWEPSQKDALQDWWIELDLGRMVMATKIVLKFVEEGKGDPFLRFSLSTSVGISKQPSSTIFSPLEYKTIYWNFETKGERTVEFDLKPKVTVYAPYDDPLTGSRQPFHGTIDTSWVGLPVQYVKIGVTASKFGKAELLSESEYQSLPEEARGDVEYFRITATGKEELISQEGYEKLPPESRGSIKYWRREMPRLAEVEVWSVGDNVALGLLDRGGSIELPLSGRLSDGDQTVDGLMLSYAKFFPYWPEKGRDGAVFDLGSTFLVDGISVFQGSNDCDLFVSDGPLENPVWESIEGKAKISARGGLFDSVFPSFLYLFDNPRKVRFLKLRNIVPQYRIDWNLAVISRYGLGLFLNQYDYLYEVQVYSHGYQPEVELLSPLIDVGGSKVLAALQWEADITPGTKVEIRTRTGNTLGIKKRYFHKDKGIEITEEEYNKLPESMKYLIQIRTEIDIGVDWSGWSSFYPESGGRLQSPNRKRYIQLEVKLLSDDPNQAPTLKSIFINYQTALVNGAKVKINPNRLEKGAGKPVEVSLTIKPSFVPEDIGFDKIMIVNPFTWVRDTRFRLPRLFKGQTELSEGSDYRQVPTQDDTLLFTFPKVMKQGDVDSLEVRFTTELYWQTQVFDVYLGNSSLSGIWQSCEEENSELTTGQIGIYGLDWKSLYNVEVEPKVFTPNGDGINDEVEVRFGVTMWSSAEVFLEVYDKSGRRLRKYREERPETASGQYTFVWDGKDESGRKVPPGVYVLKMSIPKLEAVKVRSVGVAY